MRRVRVVGQDQKTGMKEDWRSVSGIVIVANRWIPLFQRVMIKFNVLRIIGCRLMAKRGRWNECQRVSVSDDHWQMRVILCFYRVQMIMRTRCVFYDWCWFFYSRILDWPSNYNGPLALDAREVWKFKACDANCVPRNKRTVGGERIKSNPCDHHQCGKRWWWGVKLTGMWRGVVWDVQDEWNGEKNKNEAPNELESGIASTCSIIVII